MFKHNDKKKVKIDQSQLSEEEKDGLGIHINKPLLIICIILLIAIVVLTIIVSQM